MVLMLDTTAEAIRASANRPPLDGSIPEVDHAS
jgi:hypothetical protein